MPYVSDDKTSENSLGVAARHNFQFGDILAIDYIGPFNSVCKSELREVVNA